MRSAAIAMDSCDPPITMDSCERPDAIVVGSGACGGVAARLLTEAGFRVLLLEAGPALVDGSRLSIDNGDGTESDDLPSSSNEDDVMKVQGVSVSGVAATLYTSPRLNPYLCTHPYLWVRGRQLGGRTRTWGRGVPRMTNAEFKAASTDGHGQDWPIDYSDLRPHYERVEGFLRVVGAGAAAGQSSSTGIPARPMTPDEHRFKEAVEGRWTDRRVVLFPYANPFDEGEEPDFARASTVSASPTYDCSIRSLLFPAAATGRLAIRTNAIVRQVEMNSETGRAHGVRYIDRHSHEEHVATARVVVLCASTLESTRILLNSAAPRWPDGLANSSGALGRYLVDHIWGPRIRAERSWSGSPPPMPPPMLIPSFSRKGAKHLRGYQLLCELEAPQPSTLSLGIVGHGEALTSEHNRVTVDKQVVDAWGIPVLRIDYKRSENDLLMAQEIVAAAEEIAEVAGFSVVERSRELLTPGASVHEMGTARMGTQPSNSVVNSFGQTWDVPNLFVTDGATFVSAGAQNPTLTMMAITARACGLIIDMLSTGET